MNLGIKLLVAEDDPNLGAILKAYLTQKGYTVYLVTDGQQALETYHQGGIDACVLDIMMPIKDGFTVAKEIRRIDKQIPLLFLTARNLEADKLKGFEIGDGFALAGMKGSEANDAYINKDGHITTLTNHSGGIQGGITNGNDVVFRVAFKPIPSITQPQQTVNRAGEPCEITIEGRHDVCALPRTLVLVEALAAMVTLDMEMMSQTL